MTWSPSAALRRLWPQRLRTRLAVFYSILFIAAGLGVVALGYTVANGLFAGPTPPKLARLTPSEQSVLSLCKSAPKAAPSPPKLLSECQRLVALVSPGQNGPTRAALRAAALIAALLVGLGAIALGWLAAGRALRPLRSIADAATDASELRLGQRLGLSGPDDELKALADTFDLMLERLDAAFTSQQRFVANAAHELRTPLTAMRTAIEVTLAKPERTPAQLEAMAQRVKLSVERAESTIEALLTLAASELGSIALENVDLATAAEDALDGVRGSIEQRGITVEASLEPAPTRADRVLIDRMIANLVDNAVRHNHLGGSIWIHTRQDDGSSVFTVANTGPVVPDDQIAILFEPFARARQRLDFGDGVGLGLSIADAIARAHATEIHASGRPDGGLELSVALPG